MRYKLYIIISFILSSCANMVVPTGGKKDEIIPELKSSNLKTTNFTERIIKLQFDEYVTLEDPINNISIQPKHSTIKTDIIAKTLLIKIDSALRPNTTYTLTIDKGIKDIHEGNVYSYNYTFSTGNSLDTNYTEYAIQNLDNNKNIKIGLTNQNIDSINQLKFEYLYNLKTSTIRVNGLSDTRYKVWIFTDKNSDLLPDEYAPIYYDTFIPNRIKKIDLNGWYNFKNEKVKKYSFYTKIYKPLNDISTYGFDEKNTIYITKDSALFYQNNNDTFPKIELRNEIINIVKSGLLAVKLNKDYIVNMDKSGINNLNILDPIKYTEDNNFITINTKYKIDSLNIKYKRNNDSFHFTIKIDQFQESSKLSTLKINKLLNKDTIIMFLYKDDKVIITKKIVLDKDLVFYMQPGKYKIEFFKTNSYQNLSFNIKKLKRISTPLIKKEILLKPNWDEVLQLIF